MRRSILETIGNTPLVELRRVRPCNGCRVLVKVEALNPGGSIKCRPAYAMIRAAEEQGLLKPDSIIVEATSGNQGIALSMVGAALGYRVRIVMPANMSKERQMIVRAYGAELVLTDPGSDIGQALDTCLKTVRKMAEEDPQVFVVGQFSNPANPASHRQETAVEIIEQVGDQGPVHAFVSGIGTGGTITGVGEALKKVWPDCEVVAAEPENAAILSGGKIGHHVQQGIGDGLIPEVLNTKIIDEIVVVSDKDAVATSLRLAREEGLFVGVSSGTNVWAALRVAENLGPGKTVVTLCPDTAERYLSMKLLDYC
ncbi:MAG: cysteine synthase A [Firmicutes bacterium]|nr:cysteine synthase A [Bacillota bacterium]